jgi:hypothetical protein
VNLAGDPGKGSSLDAPDFWNSVLGKGLRHSASVLGVHLALGLLVLSAPARRAWLHAEWQRVDRWVEEHRTSAAPADP